MTLGVEFEEDTFGRRSQPISPITSATTNRPAAIVSQNLNNYYKQFQVAQNPSANMSPGAYKDSPFVVRVILKLGIVKKPAHANIVVLVLFLIMIAVSLYFFFRSFSGSEINTIFITNT